MINHSSHRKNSLHFLLKSWEVVRMHLIVFIEITNKEVIHTWNYSVHLIIPTSKHMRELDADIDDLPYFTACFVLISMILISPCSNIKFLICDWVCKTKFLIAFLLPFVQQSITCMTCEYGTTLKFGHIMLLLMHHYLVITWMHEKLW